MAMGNYSSRWNEGCKSAEFKIDVKDFPGGPCRITKVLKSGRSQKRRLECCNTRKAQPAITGFENGRGPWAKVGGRPLEAEKGKEPPERSAALLILWFEPIETCFGFVISRTVWANECTLF